MGPMCCLQTVKFQNSNLASKNPHPNFHQLPHVLPLPFPRRPLKEAAPAEHHLELLRGLHEAQRLRSALLSQAAAGVDQEAIERLPGGAVGDGSWPWLQIPFFKANLGVLDMTMAPSKIEDKVVLPWVPND